MNVDDFVEKNKILECVCGSTAYGFATPESDEDIRGLTIPPVESFIVSDFTFFNKEDEDLGINKSNWFLFGPNSLYHEMEFTILESTIVAYCLLSRIYNDKIFNIVVDDIIYVCRFNNWHYKDNTSKEIVVSCFFVEKGWNDDFPGFNIENSNDCDMLEIVAWLQSNRGRLRHG